MTKKHLTLKDRINIQSGLDKGLKFYEIAILIGKDKCTVSKEVRKHLTIKKTGAGGQRYNPCAKAGKCWAHKNVQRRNRFVVIAAYAVNV